MEPFSLWIILVCICLIVRLWLAPIAKDRWVAADMRTKLLKAGSLAVLEKVQDLAAIGASALTAAMLVVWAAGHLAATPLGAPRVLIDATASAYTTVKEFADVYGKLLTVFGIIAATYALFQCARQAKRRVSQTWSRKAEEVYARLRENPTEIDTARADADLKPIVEDLDALVAELAGLDEAHSREPSNAAHEKIEKDKREELSAALSALAIEIARKDVTLDTFSSPADGESAPQEPGSRLLRILTGERFCKDIGLIKKPLSRIVTALLFITLIGWSAEPFANSLQLIVNNLRVNLMVEEAHRDLDVALSRATPEAEDPTPPTLPNPVAVQAASRMLANAAVREMVQSSMFDEAVSIDRTALSRTEFVRAAIDGQVYQPDTSTASTKTQKVREGVARMAMKPVTSANDLRHAESEVATALLPSVQRLAAKNPGRLQRIVDQVQTRYAAPMAPLDAQGELLSNVIDEAFGTFDSHPVGEMATQADALLKEFGKQAVMEWVQAVAQRFVTQAIVDTARPEVWAQAAGNMHFETSDDAHRFLVALNAEEGHSLHNLAADNEAHMNQQVAAFVAKGERNPDARQMLIARMSGYDSLFPSHDDDSVSLAADRSGPSPGPAGPNVAGGGNESERASQGVEAARSSEGRIFANARAKIFDLASLSFRVRGVLIGQDAASMGLDVTDLKWTMQPATSGQPTRVTLEARIGAGWRTLGTFDAAVVNQALRYAADGRVIAITITPGDGHMLGRLIYVHPALVDTPLGCRIVDADRFIDAFSLSDDLLRASPALAQLASDRVNTYYWMRNIEIAERVASIPQDRECPRAALEQLVLQGKLKQSRFAPALGRSLADFMDDQERRAPGSTKFLRTATKCSAGAIGDFAACMCRDVKPAGLTARYWFPEDHTSQLRERNVMEKPDLQWMRTSKDRLGNLDLWVHITFSLRDRDDHHPDEASAKAVEFPFDELVQLRQAVADGLPAYLQKYENTASYDDFMSPIEQFIIVQRFARSAFSGKLGRDFPGSRLIELARVTRQFVPFQRTIRWEPADPNVDITPMLQEADAHAADAYKSWVQSQEERRRMHKPICDAASR